MKNCWFSVNYIVVELVEAMAEFTLGYREVITDQELYEKWIEITLTTGQYKFFYPEAVSICNLLQAALKALYKT